MAWTTPVTRATGYIVLASDWNNEHVNNLLYLGGFKKSTSKQVANTVVETDLFNGEITIAAGILGSTGSIRGTAWGDWSQASGADKVGPRFKLKLGGTTLLDTNTCVSTFAASNAARSDWRIQFEITLLGAANAQWASITGWVLAPIASGDAAGAGTFVVGNGIYVVATPSPGGPARLDGGGAGAVDTTLASALVLSVINPSATATDTTLKGVKGELLP